MQVDKPACPTLNYWWPVYSSCNFGRMLSVGAIHFEDRFALAKKGRIGGGGQDSAWGAVHMAAALAGCRKALNASEQTSVISWHNLFWW